MTVTYANKRLLLPHHHADFDAVQMSFNADVYQAAGGVLQPAEEAALQRWCAATAATQQQRQQQQGQQAQEQSWVTKQQLEDTGMTDNPYHIQVADVLWCPLLFCAVLCVLAPNQWCAEQLCRTSALHCCCKHAGNSGPPKAWRNCRAVWLVPFASQCRVASQVRMGPTMPHPALLVATLFHDVTFMTFMIPCCDTLL